MKCANYMLLIVFKPQPQNPKCVLDSLSGSSIPNVTEIQIIFCRHIMLFVSPTIISGLYKCFLSNLQNGISKRKLCLA